MGETYEKKLPRMSQPRWRGAEVSVVGLGEAKAGGPGNSGWIRRK